MNTVSLQKVLSDSTIVTGAQPHFFLGGEGVANSEVIYDLCLILKIVL
jgi:hypothetical protein